jgi:excisionase family DNA binding protein
MDNHYISSSEAEAILGLKPYSIQKIIRKGKIPAQKIANRWLLLKTDVDEFAKSYVPRVGRPNMNRGPSKGERNGSKNQSSIVRKG